MRLPPSRADTRKKRTNYEDKQTRDALSHNSPQTLNSFYLIVIGIRSVPWYYRGRGVSKVALANGLFIGGWGRYSKYSHSTNGSFSCFRRTLCDSSERHTVFVLSV